MGRSVRGLLAGVLVGAAAATVGCVTDQGMLPVAVTRDVNLDLTQVDTSKVTVHRDVSGSDTQVTSILFIPTFRGPSLQRAVNDALARTGGDALTAVRVEAIDWWFGVGVSTLRVRGNSVDLAAGASASAPPAGAPPPGAGAPPPPSAPGPKPSE
jgi:hypothetical protein